MVVTKRSEKEGFESIYENSNFKCAYITLSPQYAFGKVKEMKRHNDSDEVFVLLSGSAVLLTHEEGSTEYTQTPLEYQTAYNVQQSTWHYLAVSEDALVFVSESGSMKRENTETRNVESENLCISQKSRLGV